jgi:two-component system invasion response regulator UvrY
MIRLLVADDHEIVREGVRRIVEHHPDMEIAVEVDNTDDLLAQLHTHGVDVLLLDIAMPGLGFLQAMEQVRNLDPELPVLVLSVYPEEDWAVRSLKAGAAGYVEKTRSTEELAAAIRRVHQGGRYVSPTLAESLALDLSPDRVRATHESLSNREHQVLCLLGAGKLVKQIAAELGVSPKTVSTYRARVLEKLQLQSNADLVRYVTEHNLEV